MMHQRFYIYILSSFLTCTQMPIGRADTVRLLGHPLESLGARVASIDSATSEVFISTFIWAEGSASTLIAHALQRALARGVRVRIAIDAGALSFCNANARDMLRTLQNQGAEIHIYNGVQWQNWRRLITPTALLNRAHDKVHLVDDHYAILGSRNIWDNSFELAGLKMMELDVAVRGTNVPTDVASYVNAYWERTYPWRIPQTSLKPVKLALGVDALNRLRASPAYRRGAEDSNGIDVGTKAQFVWDHRALAKPGPNHIDYFEQWLLASVDAGATLKVASPWIILTPRIKRILQALIARNVTIELFLNSELQAEYVGSYFGFLQRTLPFAKTWSDAISVRLWQGRTMHFKALSDGHTSYIGAYNIGPQSELRNFETGLMVTNAEFATQLEVVFAKFRDGATHLEPAMFHAKTCNSLWARISAPFF